MADDPRKSQSSTHSIFWWYCELSVYFGCEWLSVWPQPEIQLGRLTLCEWVCVCASNLVQHILKQLSMNSSGGRRALYSSWHGCGRKSFWINIRRISAHFTQHSCVSLTDGSQGWQSHLAHFLRISQSIHTLISHSMPTSFLNLSPGLFLPFLALSVTWECVSLY